MRRIYCVNEQQSLHIYFHWIFHGGKRILILEIITYDIHSTIIRLKNPFIHQIVVLEYHQEI